jgi:hypothetical protein
MNIAEFWELFFQGFIIDARHGGLLVGEDDDNIPVIQMQPDGTFQHVAWFQNMEYILNSYATHQYMDRLHEINADRDFDAALSEIKLSEKSSIINAHGIGQSKYVLIDSKGQFIVNREATAKYFYELETLNNDAESPLFSYIHFETKKTDEQ